jgi:hypothetical protein
MADNTVLPTGVGGDTIASDDIGGIKFQRIKLIYGADGVNSGDVSETNPLPITVKSDTPSYTIFMPAVAVGANKVFLDLFNATGTAKIIKVKSIRAIKDGSVAVTGVLSVKLHLTRTTTVGTGGTAAVENGTVLTTPAISEHDTASAALPAGITARLAPAGGATGGAVICERHVFSEETNASTYDRIEFLLPEALDVQPLVIRENEGIRIVQGAIASVGNIGFSITFELE